MIRNISLTYQVLSSETSFIGILKQEEALTQDVKKVRIPMVLTIN